MNLNNMRMQQDGAPSHIARNTRAISHLYRSLDVASKQSRLEPCRLTIMQCSSECIAITV